MRAQFSSLKSGFETLRVRFGLASLTASAAPGPLGGGFGFGAPNPLNVYGRFTGLKGGILGVWETPSAGTMAQVRETRSALDAALREANALLAQSVRVGEALRARGLTLAP